MNMPLKATNGNFHQANVVSFGRGVQCTMIAFAALLAVFSGRYIQPQHWTPEIIDDIVVTGSHLYDDTAATLGWTEPRYLFQNEIPASVEMWNSIYNIEVYDNLFYGLIGSNTDMENMASTFRSAAAHAFQMSNLQLFNLQWFNNCNFYA